MTPTVSVIMPTFNRAHLIGQAIDSVLAQTYTDYELVVVDDGSTDDTEQVVARYGSRVRYFRIRHSGVGRARNIAEQHARGRYITVLDSDDLLYPYALEIQTRVLDRFPDVAFVCAEMSGFDDNGFEERYHLKTYHASAYHKPSLTYDHIFESSVALTDAGLLPDGVVEQDPTAAERRAYFGNVFHAYLNDTVLCQNSVMIRRSVLAKVGKRNERIRHWDVVDHLLRICRDHRIGFVDVPTYKMRFHDGQISTTVRADGKAVWLRKQQWLLRVVKHHALSDRTYYENHRHRLHGRLAHLHRAVAVPAMLLGRGRRARAHLQRCWQYGQSEWSLWLLSFMPQPVRRLGVTIVERLRFVWRTAFLLCSVCGA